MELIHKTPTGGIPGALTAYKGRLLAGIGSALRIYDMGKKKLLRKSEYRNLPTLIVSLQVNGDRIYVGDQQVILLSSVVSPETLRHPLTGGVFSSSTAKKDDLGVALH